MHAKTSSNTMIGSWITSIIHFDLKVQKSSSDCVVLHIGHIASILQRAMKVDLSVLSEMSSPDHEVDVVSYIYS